MDLREMAILLEKINDIYPLFFSNKTEAEKTRAVKSWHEYFALDDARLVAMAIKSLIANHEGAYAPTVGQIKAQMRRCLPNTELSEQEAWNEVRRAVKNGSYGSEEEFNKLSPLVKKTVGRPEAIREWASANSDDLETVIASNFMRTYRAEAVRQKNIDVLPNDVKAILEGIKIKKIGG